MKCSGNVETYEAFLK